MRNGRGNAGNRRRHLGERGKKVCRRENVRREFFSQRDWDPHHRWVSIPKGGKRTLRRTTEGGGKDS